VACGAVVPAVTVPTPYACTYCGCEQLVGPKGAPAPPPYPDAPVPFAARPASSPVPALLTVGVLVAVLVVGGVLAAFATMRRTGGVSGPPLAPFAPNPGSPGAGGVTPPGEHTQWAASGGASVVVVGDVNGDGVEDFVGRYRVLDVASGSAALYVGAFDGKTLKRLWAAGPYGTLVEGGASTEIAAAGGRVVVTDFRAKAHVLDLRTGKELSSTALSDRAKSICSPGDARTEVWLDLVDETHGTIDTATSKWTPAPRPTWCAPLDGEACAGRIAPELGGGPCGVSMSDISSFKDLLPRMWLRGAPLDVVIGTKTPGTPVATALGLDPKTHAVRWRTTLAPDPAVSSPMDFTAATLAGGRLVTTYATTTPDTLHLLVIDAATGARQADVSLPNTISADMPGEIVVSGARVYVPHWTWLDVVDLHAGTLVGTVGIW
jgi:PQQ-like domain